MKAATWRIVALCGLLGLVAGCALGPRPETKFYALDPGPAPSLRALGGNATAAVNYVEVAAPFAGSGFVYQLAGGRWETDPYHQFLAAPADLFTGMLRKWVRDSGYYRFVAEPVGQGGQDDLIEASLVELAGDFREPSAPRAVVALRVQVFRRTADGRVVVLDRTFRQSVPVSGRTPEALVTGWNEAVRLAFSEMLRALVSARG